MESRFLFIKQSYGYAAYKAYQYFEKLWIKHVRLTSDLYHLQECKWNDLIPNFLYFTPANTSLCYTRAYKRCQNILLREEISLKKKNIKFLSGLLHNAQNELENIFPVEMMKEIENVIDQMQSIEESAEYESHRKKFRNLLNFKYQEEQRRIRKRINYTTKLTQSMTNAAENEEVEPKLVWNFSKRNLTEEELRVLEKGLTFNRAGPINRCNVISNVEYLFCHASGVEKELIDFKKWDEDPDVFSTKETRILEPKQLSLAADLKNATEKFFRQADMSIKGNRNQSENKTKDHKLLINLSKDSSILITKPDKGRGVVVLDRNEYTEKLETILSDATKFKLLERDPTISRETSLTTLLRQMKNEEYLTQNEYKYVRPIGSAPARLYSLPKVHKTNVPLRPIVSCIQSYNYKLGKFLADLIKSIRDNYYSLKNNRKFLEFLREQSNLSINNKMISFDIESLFTNIPVDETIEIICNKLYFTDPKLKPFIPEHYLHQLLNFATKFTHFLFNKKYYDQRDSVSMGTPLAAIFAEIFMAHFEEQYLPALLNNNGSKLLAWRRYVNDMFTIFREDADEEQIRQLLNTFHPCIKFTVEPENDGKISFLDVLVKRHDEGFDTTVYKKKQLRNKC